MSAKKPPRHLVALDWDTRYLRVVHASMTKRGAKIDRLLSARIPPEVDPNDAEQMGAHIRSVLSHERILTKHVIVDVPRDQAVLNTLHLPAGAPDELPGMVQIQIAKELSFPVDEAVVDYTLGPRVEGDPNIDVLVAAVRTEVVQQYEAICSAAGLKLDRIGLRPQANKVAICEQLKTALPERVVLIDVRPTFTEVDVLRNGHLAFSRAVSVMVPEQGSEEEQTLTLLGANGETEEEVSSTDTRLSLLGGPSTLAVDSVVDALVVEMTRSIEAYRAHDPGAKIDHVVIGGDTGVEERLSEVIAERLSVTTEIYNPASTFGWESDEGAAASAFAASLGLVLGHADQKALYYDFLNPKKMVSEVRERLKKAPLVAAAVLLLAAAGPIALWNSTRADYRRLAEIEERIEELQGRKRQNEAFLKLVREIEAFDTQQYVWSDVLYDVMAALPARQELVIDDVHLKQSDGQVVLKTRAKDRDTAHKALGALADYRRYGIDKPLFEASMPGQEEKTGKYSFSQALNIDLQKAALPKVVQKDHSSKD